MKDFKLQFFLKFHVHLIIKFKLKLTNQKIIPD